MNDKIKPQTILLLIILISVAVRMVVALYLGDEVTNFIGGTTDQRSYDLLAQRVANGYGFTFAEPHWPFTPAETPTAHWSYAYTLLLSAIYGLFDHRPLVARLFQAVVIGAVMPWLTFRIGKSVFSVRTGLIAAFITSIYSYFILYAATLMTEGFFFVTILWSFDVVWRIACRWQEQRPASFWLAAELGFVIALSILFRQVILFAHIFTAMWLALIAWRWRAGFSFFRTGAIATMVIVLLIAPWIVRNQVLFGRISLPNTNSGFAFFWANHSIYEGKFETVLSPSHGVTYQQLIPIELRHLNESKLDAALTKRGLEWVMANPVSFFELTLSRILVQFQFWPDSGSSSFANIARFVSSAPTLLFGFAGSILALQRIKWKELVYAKSHEALQEWFWLLLLSFIVVYNGIHIVTWAKIRYRFPTDVMLILFAALAIHILWEFIAKYSHQSDVSN